MVRESFCVFMSGACTILVTGKMGSKGETLMTDLVCEGLMRVPGWPGFYSLRDERVYYQESCFFSPDRIFVSH